MSQISTEQWERRKWYLIRSLFHEVPLLSPIPETQELLDRSASPAEVIVSRPYSPLPDLIIEREPNRHDEPEEYYQALERKVIRIYRKLFINAEKSSQSSFVENNDKGNTESQETVIFTEGLVPYQISTGTNESTISNDRPIDQNSRESEGNESVNILIQKLCSAREEQDKGEQYEERANEIHTKTKTFRSLVQKSTSSESLNNEIIITQALIHHTYGEDIDNHAHCAPVDATEANSLGTENHSTVNTTVVTASQTDITESDEQSEYGHSETESENSNIANNEQHVSGSSDAEGSNIMKYSITDTSSSLEQPEIMRRRDTYNESVESVKTLNAERYFSGDLITDKRSNIKDVREMEEAEVLSPEASIILGATSTFKIKRNERVCSRQDENRKRRIASEVFLHQSKSPKQTKLENLAIQTSFSRSCNSERNFQEIQNHFFEGNPQIFKLCSCRNHVCC